MRRLVLICVPILMSLLGSIRTSADDDAEIKQARKETTNQLKQLGVAMHVYHDRYKRFPPPAILSEDGKPLLSWRVAILPFLEQTKLHEQFHLDEPWDSPHNKALLPKMPGVYRCPRSKAGDDHRTIYQVPVGPNTLFPGPEGVPIRSVTDGTSLTIMMVEVDEEHAAPWTKPADWSFDPEKPGAGLAGHFPHVFFVSAADASVRALPITIETDTLRALFTRNGREPVAFPE